MYKVIRKLNFFVLIFSLNCLLNFSVMANNLIEATLNNFHQAAAKADSEKYFDLMADDAVFLGTDATERWSKEEFKTFVLPIFNQGRGWTYYSTQRNISIASSGNVAFFDELLENHKYGQCRGSGVLWKTPQGWKIAQYNLSIPVPNFIAEDVVKQIKNAVK